MESKKSIFNSGNILVGGAALALTGAAAWLAHDSTNTAIPKSYSNSEANAIRHLRKIGGPRLNEISSITSIEDFVRVRVKETCKNDLIRDADCNEDISVLLCKPQNHTPLGYDEKSCVDQNVAMTKVKIVTSSGLTYFFQCSAGPGGECK